MPKVRQGAFGSGWQLDLQMCLRGGRGLLVSKVGGAVWVLRLGKRCSLAARAAYP